MKNFRKIISLIILLFTFSDINALACTIFTENDGNLILTGNNEDWLYHYNSMYWIVQGDNNEYARICFGISAYVQGGMNEKGLFYDGATCPQSEIPFDRNKEQLGMDMGEVILSKCATVREAVSFLEKYNIPAGLGDHLLFADASGDAAVVEWVENEMRVIWAKDNRLTATNFYLSNPELGGYPCERYDMAEKILTKPDSLSILEFSNILCSTTQDWGDGGTKYSNVYDLKALTVYLYERSDFSNVAVINLRDELAKLGPGEKYLENINSLSYQTTLSVLGEEVTNYKPAAENIQVQTVKSDEKDTDEKDTDRSFTDGNFTLYFIGSIIVIMVIILILHFYLKKQSSR